MFVKRTTSRSFPSRRRFGARRRLQVPHRPRKWERGNIYVTGTHTHDATGGPDLLTVFPLASVASIVDTVGSDAQGLGRSLTEAIRCIEIGGLVWSIDATQGWGSVSVPPTGGDQGIIDCRALLCSDRLDASTPPAPTALSTNWFTNTQPLTTVHETQDAATQYPVQIHHQEHWVLNFGSIPAEALELAAFPRVQSTESSRRSRSQRLRLRLDDTQVLVLHLASHLRNADEEVRAMEVNWCFTGTIYYRYVFAGGGR